MPYVSPDAGQGGSMVVAVKKHPAKSMAFVAFVGPEKAQAVLASPPASLCGLPVLPARPHATDRNSIVVKWSDGAHLEEQDIAAEFDAMFVGADRDVTEGGGYGSPQPPMQLILRPFHASGSGFAVRKVTKHPTKPLAFVAFNYPEQAQAAVMHPSPLRSIGPVQLDPITPHRAEPDTVVLFWRPTPGADLAEKDIADYCEELAAGPAPAPTQMATWSPPNWRSVAGKGKGKYMPQPVPQSIPQPAPTPAPTWTRNFVDGVKKHPSKSMAFVTFRLEEVTQAALMEANTLTTLGQVPLDPLVPHKEDPRTVVVYWRAESHALSADMIADFFEAFMADLFGAPAGRARPGGPGMVSPVPGLAALPGAAETGGLEFSPESVTAKLDPSRPLVVGVKKHPTKTMAFVNFQTSDLTMVALGDPDPPRNIGPATIEPIRPHKTDPFSIVVYWHPGPDMYAEDIAGHYEFRLASILGLASPQHPSLEEMKMAIGLDPRDSFVVRVKQSIPKKTAFVTFQSPDVAQAVLQDGAVVSCIAGVKVDPLELHRTDPTTVVLFWKNVPNLDPWLIQEHFEARCAELLRESMAPPEALDSGPVRLKPVPQVPGAYGGKGGGGCSGGYAYGGPGGQQQLPPSGGGTILPPVLASPQGQAYSQGPTGPPPGQLFTSHQGIAVRKHGAQPMAFIILPSEALAQAILVDPPSAICGVPVLPARPHNTNPKAIVVRWMGNADLPESSIAAGIAEFAAPLLQAGVPETSPAVDVPVPSELLEADPASELKRGLEEAEGGDGGKGTSPKRFREGPLH